MNIKFQKYQGAGNDFIIIDNRSHLYEFSSQIVEFLCNRKFGIGADGLMLLEEADGYDFRMRYFNSDGKEASLCGNGSRCIVAFARSLGLIGKTTRFIATDGEHTATIEDDNVCLKMSDVSAIIRTDNYFFMNTGSPHYVQIVDDCFNYDVYNEGRRIRNSACFQPDGTNVNFITPTPQYISVVTYERGVENETLACGTGCVASALAVAHLRNDTKNTYDIRTKGGNLQVSFQRNGEYFHDILLKGPAKFVFQGEISINGL